VHQHGGPLPPIIRSRSVTILTRRGALMAMALWLPGVFLAAILARIALSLPESAWGEPLKYFAASSLGVAVIAGLSGFARRTADAVVPQVLDPRTALGILPLLLLLLGAARCGLVYVTNGRADPIQTVTPNFKPVKLEPGEGALFVKAGRGKFTAAAGGEPCEDQDDKKDKKDKEDDCESKVQATPRFEQTFADTLTIGCWLPVTLFPGVVQSDCSERTILYDSAALGAVVANPRDQTHGFEGDRLRIWFPRSRPKPNASATDLHKAVSEAWQALALIQFVGSKGQRLTGKLPPDPAANVPQVVEFDIAASEQDRWARVARLSADAVMNVTMTTDRRTQLLGTLTTDLNTTHSQARYIVLGATGGTHVAELLVRGSNFQSRFVAADSKVPDANLFMSVPEPCRTAAKAENPGEARCAWAGTRVMVKLAPEWYPDPHQSLTFKNLTAAGDSSKRLFSRPGDEVPWTFEFVSSAGETQGTVECSVASNAITVHLEPFRSPAAIAELYDPERGKNVPGPRASKGKSDARSTSSWHSRWVKGRPDVEHPDWVWQCRPGFGPRGRPASAVARLDGQKATVNWDERRIDPSRGLGCFVQQGNPLDVKTTIPEGCRPGGPELVQEAIGLHRETYLRAHCELGRLTVCTG
jgi:hypothetical protein